MVGRVEGTTALEKGGGGMGGGGKDGRSDANHLSRFRRRVQHWIVLAARLRRRLKSSGSKVDYARRPQCLEEFEAGRTVEVEKKTIVKVCEGGEGVAEVKLGKVVADVGWEVFSNRWWCRGAWMRCDCPSCDMSVDLMMDPAGEGVKDEMKFIHDMREETAVRRWHDEDECEATINQKEKTGCTFGSLEKDELRRAH